jgi:hypothetical protein
VHEGEGGREGSPGSTNVEQEEPSDGGVLEAVVFLPLATVRGGRGEKGLTLRTAFSTRMRPQMKTLATDPQK